MNSQTSPYPVLAALPSPVVTLDLDQATAVKQACAHLRHLPLPQLTLHIDCGQLRCQRTLGVSHVISELLVLRRAGASIWLRNVNAPLRRCLQLLQLNSLFHFVDPA